MRGCLKVWYDCFFKNIHCYNTKYYCSVVANCILNYNWPCKKYLNKGIFESMVIVVFQSVFYLKIHQNNILLFLTQYIKTI